MRRLLNWVVSGSYLALDQATNTDPEWARAQDAYNASGATPYYMYTPEQVAELFTGLEIVDRLTAAETRRTGPCGCSHRNEDAGSGHGYAGGDR